jgi:hypothetical protein
MKALVEGKEVKIGDIVGFKCDIEQYGVITAIKPNGAFGKAQLTLKPCAGSFFGEYIGGDTIYTTQSESCWID